MNGRVQWLGVRAGFAVLTAIAGLLLAPQAAIASVGTTTAATPPVNGPVYAIAQVGDLTVIGGEFTAVGGKPRQNAAAIRADGTLDPNFKPDPDGPVRAVAGSEDAGVVFLGGTFGNAGGAARANLAAVGTLDGAALPGWRADTSGSAPDVRSLAVSGSSLYVGGRFAGIDDTTRHQLAAVDTVTGDVVDGFRTRVRGGGVNEVVVSPDGSKVYAGGWFTSIGGEDRLNGAAEVWSATGDATAFDPSQGGGVVTTVGLSPDGGRLYVATENNSLFAYDLTSNDPAWTSKTSGDTQAIAVSATDVYIGGHFSQIVVTKTKRRFLASLNPSDGSVTAWDPNPDGGVMGVWAITMTPGALQVGGTFTTVGGVPRVRFARFPGTP